MWEPSTPCNARSVRFCSVLFSYVLFCAVRLCADPFRSIRSGRFGSVDSDRLGSVPNSLTFRRISSPRSMRPNCSTRFHPYFSYALHPWTRRRRSLLSVVSLRSSSIYYLVCFFSSTRVVRGCLVRLSRLSCEPRLWP